MKRILAAVVAAGVAVAPASAALAHPVPDLIAVPAGAPATVSLKPTHGCGESPTVGVRIRAPFADAIAGTVDGWTTTSAPDGAGNTVLEWSGGVLPADEDGAFPVQFTAPTSPGLLLTFPAIQVCANGEELAWISGDPAAEYPAPRVLVLPPGSEPAATLDEVPLDAPGRDQLVAIVDVDNPDATTTTVAPTTTPATTAPATAAPATTAATTTSAAPPSTAAADTTEPEANGGTVTSTTVGADDDGSSNLAPIGLAGVTLAAVGAGTAVIVNRRRSA